VYTNTTDLFLAVSEVNTAIVNTFTLAPNATFFIGTFISDKNGTFVKGGMAPLLVRKNVHYQCDGCVLVGGELQVISKFSLFSETAENARLQGITFRNATMYAASLANQGDIVFEDCVFEVRYVSH